MKNLKLNKEEKDILKDFESNKLKSSKVKTSTYKNYAKNTLSKSKNINIRLSQKDLSKIKAIAAKKGLPYQTFISSVLHQYSEEEVKL